MIESVLRCLVLILSLAGLLDAIYFTLAYYGRVKKARWVPEILCAREGSSCVTVLQTPYARLLGLPNSLLGIAYYLALIGGVPAANRLGLYRAGVGMPLTSLAWALVAASAATVVLGCYLMFTLRRKLRVHCPLCYTAHAVNVALLVLLIVLFW
jgi:uncharacterized membrane protein